jgi:hypothetical protein
MLPHQMSPAQQPQVLGNCGTRNRKRPGDLSGRLAAPAEKIKNRSACGIGQGLKRGLG